MLSDGAFMRGLSKIFLLSLVIFNINVDVWAGAPEIKYVASRVHGFSRVCLTYLRCIVNGRCDFLRAYSLQDSV